MNRFIYLLPAGIFWAVMMALLIRREILPYWEFQEPPSYRSFLRDLREPELTRRRITMAGVPVGVIESIAIPYPIGTFEIRSRMRFEIAEGAGASEDRNLYLATRAEIGRNYRLSEYRLRGVFGAIPLSMVAVPRADKMRLTVAVLVFKKTYEDLPFDPDAVVSDGFVPYFGGKLVVGRKWKVKTLDVRGMGSGASAESLTTSDLYASVEERKEIRYQGRDVPCYEVVVRKGPAQGDPISHIAYVNESGVVLATTLFFGKYVYDIRLEERRPLTLAEAQTWKWGVAMPPGMGEP